MLSGVDFSCAVEENGAVVDGVGPQTQLTLDRLRRHLADAGTTLDGVVKLV